MNTRQISIPNITRSGDHRQLLGLRIVIPLPLPDSIADRIAGNVFHSLLRTRLEAAGCTVENSNWGFPFSRSFHTFELARASDRGRALIELCQVATKHCLDGTYWIAWNDDDEGVWRLFDPASGEFPVPSAAEFKREQEDLAAAISAWNKATRNQDG